MQRFFKYISSLIIVVFTLSSILQYHHHDINGDLDLLCFDEETCITSNHKDCHIEHSDTHEEHSEDCCTLKLSTQKRPARQASVDEIYISAFTDIENIILDILQSTVVEQVYLIAHKIGTTSSCLAKITKLRAPPIS